MRSAAVGCPDADEVIKGIFASDENDVFTFEHSTQEGVPASTTTLEFLARIHCWTDTPARPAALPRGPPPRPAGPRRPGGRLAGRGGWLTH